MSNLEAIKRRNGRQLRYPRVVLNCKLEPTLKQQLGEGYLEKIASWLEVTPSTMRSILAGGTVKLENALRLASVVGLPVEDLWSVRN